MCPPFFYVPKKARNHNFVAKYRPMYLAPLNFDRFFARVFSHEHIAKRFLEDFLELEIEHIELLKQKHRLTDDAAKVEFDFRCTIGGADIIVDMQQWYKTDVVQRFYTYHTAGTVLQLEKMPDKKLLPDNRDKRAKGKDYASLKPVVTLIWMVDDTLRFSENYVGYILTPEAVREFLEKDKIWNDQQIVALLQERERLLKIMHNDTKSLDFLPQNRLVFLFQHNIVKDKLLKKYHRWFQFAEKTRNKENREGDFEEYLGDPIFTEIMRLINTKGLTKEDLDYVESEEESKEQFERFLTGERNYAKKEGEKIGIEKVALQMILDGEPDEKIKKYTGLSEERIRALRER